MLLRPPIARAELPALALLLSLAALLLALLGAALAMTWPHDAAPRMVAVGRIAELRPELPTLVQLDPLIGSSLPEIVLHDPSNPAVVYRRMPNPFSGKAPVHLYLVRTAPTTAIALLQVDPFSTCQIPWQPAEQRFIDPCHGAAYSLTGEWVRGPSLTGMIRFPATVAADGRITVDVRGAFTATKAQ